MLVGITTGIGNHLKDMNFSNKKFDDLEFVPMIWGDSMTETREILIMLRAKVISIY